MVIGQPIENEQSILQRVRSYISNHDISKAIAVAQSYIAAHPHDPLGYIGLGIVYKKTRRFKDAMFILDKAVEVGPDTVMAFSLRGFCRALLGDLNGALSDSNMALKIDPSDRMALELKNQMEKRIAMGMSPTHVEPAPRLAPVDPVLPPSSGPTACVEPPIRSAPLISPINNEKPIYQKGPQGTAGTKFISVELSQAIVDELEAEKESILILVPKMQALMATVATMQALTGMYEMDGVMICVDRPAKFHRTTFSKFSKEVDLIHYIELLAGEEPTGTPIGADACCQVYDLERIIKVIDEELEHKAKKHGGEDHFVMWDDASALKFYHEPKSLLKFFEALTEHLSSMDVVHVVLLPTEAASLLQKWPVSSFKATINVKSSWMSRFR